MRKVLIRRRSDADASAGLDFDLRDVLCALGPRAAECEWSCEGLQYCSTDEKDVRSLELAARGARVLGTALLADLPRILQVIDGEFRAFDQDALWVVLRAVDSSWWEVLSDDPAVFSRLRRSSGPSKTQQARPSNMRLHPAAAGEGTR